MCVCVCLGLGGVNGGQGLSYSDTGTAQVELVGFLNGSFGAQAQPVNHKDTKSQRRDESCPRALVSISVCDS